MPSSMVERSAQKIVATLCISGIVLATSISTGFTQPTPSSQSLCDMPSQRGTAAYNKYCGTGGSSLGSPGGSGYTPQQQTILNGAQQMMPLLQQGVHDLLYGNPQEQAARDATAAQAAAQAAVGQRRIAEELARRSEEIKNQLLGGAGSSDSSGALSLMGVENTGELKLMTGDQSPVFNTNVRQASVGCVPSQDASVVDLCALGDKPAVVDPHVVKGGAAGIALDTPPANPTLPRVAEIEKSPGAGDARKAFQSIIDKDWSAAVASFKQALLKDPSNAALKRSLELAEYTQARRIELSRENSLLFIVIDVWQSRDNKTALMMLTRIEQQHPNMKNQVAELRHQILAIEEYEKSPVYRAHQAEMARAQDQLVVDAELAMAQRSLSDQYINNGMRYVVKGNIPQARLMLKTALAGDESRGDVRILLNLVESMHTASTANNPPSSQKGPLSTLHN